MIVVQLPNQICPGSCFVAVLFFVVVAVLHHLVVRGTLNLSNDVVPLAEESEPLVQNGLLLVLEIIPLGDAIFGLEGRGGEGPRGVLSCKHYRPKISIKVLRIYETRVTVIVLP